jgi:hypothetical protein
MPRAYLFRTNNLGWHENRKSQNLQLIRNPLDPNSEIDSLLLDRLGP